MDERERGDERRAVGGDDDARTRKHVAEFRRGERFKLLYLTGQQRLVFEDLVTYPEGPRHLVSHRSMPRSPRALCNRLDVLLPIQFLKWNAWAGPDASLDAGGCDECHALALVLTNDALGTLFRRQVGYGRVVGVRHPEDNRVHVHPTTGRDLKPDEWRACVYCRGEGATDEGEVWAPCPDCSGRGWICLVVRRRTGR